MAGSRREFMTAIVAATARAGWCQTDYVIRSESSLVLVPVTVLDRSGHPVRGLTKDDFALMVDGSAAPLASFEAHLREQPDGGRGAVRGSQKTEAVLRTGEPRVISNVPAGMGAGDMTIILLIDYLNTDLNDRLTMREDALRFLADRLAPGQTFAIYGLSYRLIPLLPPMSDPVAMARAAKITLGQMDATDPPESGIIVTSAVRGTDAFMEYFKLRNARQKFVREQHDRSLRTLAAFRQLAQAFAGIPGRKELLWLTGDASPLNPSMLYQISHLHPELEANTGLGSDLAPTFERLNNANIAVFPVDVRGVKNTASLGASAAMSHEEFNQTARRGSQPEDINAYSGVNDRREGEAGNAVLAMESCARETGGEALRGNNDLDILLRRALDTWDSYYVLSFVPPPAGAKGRYVPVKVKSRQKGTRVLHRQGFWLGPQNARLDQQGAIAAAVAMPVDATEIPLRLDARRPENGEMPFSLFVSLSSENFDRAQNRYSLIIAVLTMDANGKILSRHGESVSAAVTAQQQQDIIEHGSEYRGSFPCAGADTGRVIVLDNVTGRIGSLMLAPLVAASPAK